VGASTFLGGGITIGFFNDNDFLPRDFAKDLKLNLPPLPLKENFFPPDFKAPKMSFFAATGFLTSFLSDATFVS